MGMISKTQDLLDEYRFMPAQDHMSGDAAGWTLLDLLMTAAGAHRSAVPVAYWESHELRTVLGQSWALLVPEVEGDPRVWSNQKGRTDDEIRRALAAVAEDVDPPGELRLRPGSTTALKSTCRIPFVPTVAAVQAWMLLGEEVPVIDFLSHYGIEPGTKSLELLERLDPIICSTEIPAGLVDAATAIRKQMSKAQPEVRVTAQFLHLVARIKPTATISDTATADIRTETLFEGVD